MASKENQEALDSLLFNTYEKDFYGNRIGADEDYDILQQAIDEYSELKTYIKEISKVQYTSEVPDYSLKDCKFVIDNMRNELKRLYKALDKVCNQLEKFTLQMYDNGVSFKPCIMNKDYWKEWSLDENKFWEKIKESEKQ